MDIIQLYQDFSIPYYTEGKNVATGWINVQCPHCDDHSNHLGFNPESNSFVCWKCGAHKTTETLSQILNISFQESRKIQEQYGGYTSTNPEPKVEIHKRGFKYPSDIKLLTEYHKKYLEGRNYDAERLERDWGLFSAGPMAMLDQINYSHRIIIPIHWDKKVVSFQGRDITGKNPIKYKACPKPRELKEHQTILGGKQEYWSDTGIICEGFFDVFRLGLSSCCTFGIEYTPEQMRLIAKTFKRVAVAFDFEPQAQAQAKKLIAELQFRGRDAFLVDIPDDPGKLEQVEADYLVKQILKK
jgi:DNA primase